MTRFGYFLSCEEYIGQVGGEHEGFFEFYADAVLPRLRER